MASRKRSPRKARAAATGAATAAPTGVAPAGTAPGTPFDAAGTPFNAAAVAVAVVRALRGFRLRLAMFAPQPCLRSNSRMNAISASTPERGMAL